MATLRKRCRHKGAARKRCSCAWYADYRDADGERHQANLGNDYREARRELLRITNNEGLAVKTSSAFDEIADNYLAQCELQGLRPQTLGAYRNNVAHAVRYFGDVPAGSITGPDIVKYGHALLANGAGHTHARKLRGTVITVLNFAAEIGVVEAVPTVPRWKVPQDARSQRVEIPSLSTAEALVAACPPEIRDGLSLLIWTGMRVGELLALTPDDLDLDARRISITKTVQTQTGEIGPPKSPYSTREIILANDALAIAEQITLPVPTTYWPMAKRWRRVRGTVPEAEGVRIHDLRHLNVSMRLAEGQTVPFIAGQVGDTAQTIMGTYAHVIESMAEDEAGRLVRHDGLA